MSDLTPPEPANEPSVPNPGAEQELEVDLAAFLPEGVELGEATVLDDELVVVATDDGIVAVEEIVVATEDEIVVIDEVVAVAAEPDAPAEPAAPPVDLEALSQIERDLDAVDAAIAALDAGTYGIDASGQPIDDALLAEDPTRLS